MYRNTSEHSPEIAVGIIDYDKVSTDKVSTVKVSTDTPLHPSNTHCEASLPGGSVHDECEGHVQK